MRFLGLVLICGRSIFFIEWPFAVVTLQFKFMAFLFGAAVAVAGSAAEISKIVSEEIIDFAAKFMVLV